MGLNPIIRRCGLDIYYDREMKPSSSSIYRRHEVIITSHSDSLSLRASFAVSLVEAGEGGSGGRSSCIRYFSLIHGLTSS